MAKTNEIRSYLGLDLTKFEKGLKNAESKMYRSMRNLDRMGKELTNTISVPIVILGGLATKVFADFEQSMLKVKAISGATEKEFQSLTKIAKELGSTTMFTASQVAELQLNLSKLGLSTKQINQSTASILSLAQATDSDLAEAATVAAGTLKGFGLEAKEMGRVADVMASSFSSTALDMEKFKVSMAYVAPVAKQANVSLEETTAILGALVNRNIDASSAGAALRNVYLDLADKGLSWSDAMESITSSTNPLSTAMALFDKRGANVATVIANNAMEIKGLTTRFKDAEGEAKRMADIMDSGLMGAFRKLKSEIEGVGIEIGEKLTPIVLSLGKVLSQAIKWWRSLSDSTQMFIIKAALITAVLGPVFIILSKLIGVVKFLIPAFKLLTVTMATNPFGLLAIGVATLVTGIIVLSEKLNNVTDETKFLNEASEGLNKSIAKEQAELKRLFSAMQDLSKPMSDRQEALDAINESYPGYLNSTQIEEINLNKVADAYERVSIAMRNKLIDQKKESALTELTEKQIELELKKQRIERDGYGALSGSKFGSGEKAKIDPLGIFRKNGETGEDYAVRAALEGIDEELKAIEETSKRVNKEFDQLKNANVNPRGGAGGRGYNYGLSKKGGGTSELDGTLVTQPKKEKETPDEGTPLHLLNLIDPFSGMKQLTKMLEMSVKSSEGKLSKITIDPKLSTKNLDRDIDHVNQIFGDLFESLGEKFDRVLGHVSDIFGRMSGIIDQFYTNKYAQIEKDYETQKKFIENAVGREGDKAKMMEQIEGERVKKVGQIKRKEAIASKGQAIFDSILNTATAISKALTAGPVAGPIMAGIIGAMGVAQTALIASQPIPALAQGGLIYGPTLSLVGDNKNAAVDPEVVAPLSKLKNIMGGGGGTHLTGNFGIHGDDLRIIIDNAKFNHSRNSGYGRAI